VIPTVLMFEGLRRIGAGKASVVGAVEPVSTILFGVAILGESITVLRVIGATLVIAAVVILALGENRAAIAVTAQ
jgi:DME family drug/metabolite transporter